MARPERSEHGQVRNLDAHIALRALVHRAADQGATITPKSMAVLLAVLSETVGYSRLTDRVPVAQLARLAHLGDDPDAYRSVLSKSLRRLQELDIGLVYEPGNRYRAPLVGVDVGLLEAARRESSTGLTAADSRESSTGLAAARRESRAPRRESSGGLLPCSTEKIKTAPPSKKPNAEPRNTSKPAPPARQLCNTCPTEGQCQAEGQACQLAHGAGA